MILRGLLHPSGLGVQLTHSRQDLKTYAYESTCYMRGGKGHWQLSDRASGRLYTVPQIFVA